MRDIRPYDVENARQLDRMRALITRLSDEELAQPVNDEWTVAGVLAHIAFWDARALVLAERIERGIAFSAEDAEPAGVDWINDATRPLIHAIPPRRAAELALDTAEQIDGCIATLDPAKLWPNDQTSPVNAFRSEHRGEHLDEIETALAK